MATTLPPIVHSPFGRYFPHKPYIFDGPREPHPTIENVSTTALASAISINPRQTSTSSVLSVASAPLQLRNNENRGAYDVLITTSGKRSISLNQANTHARPSLGRPKKFHRSEAFNRCQTVEFSATCLPRTSQFRGLNEPSRECAKAPRSRKKEALPGTLDQRLDFLASSSASEGASAETVDNGVFENGDEVDKDDSKFRQWANSFRRRRNVPPRTSMEQGHEGPPLRPSGHDAHFNAQPSSRFLFAHHRRLSNSSSGFVETVKTASFSNPSMSMGPRSHRLTRSTETHGNRSSHVRYSIDSDRPTNRPSLDEGALRRGLRRGQILRELLMSEESYLVDLRALSNLFSTLLASVTSTSAQAKANIQRNLLEILHLHTDLANELYRVSTVDMSSHQWSERLLRKAGACSYAKRSSLESHRNNERDPKDRPSRHSIDSVDSNALLRTAEPREAADIARAFRHLMPRFFIYEDYCSNHEVMLREVVASQRSTSSWPLYETGIEALTRSVRAINHRRGSSKRAMTVGDLLMSPIQRLTKYPLLLADLHKSTPVIDCPDSHVEVDWALRHLRELVREVNHATDDRVARERIRKRWLLQDRFAFDDDTLHASQFRMLGHPILCGVLHLAYQTRTHVRGAYGLCVLFETHVILGVPARQAEKFDAVAVIHLANLKIESTSDGKGLQCHTALFSWKMVFESDQQLFEVILSACSAAEEEQWKVCMARGKELSGTEAASGCPGATEPRTSVSPDLKPVAVVFGQAGTLARRLSVQRAATVGTRTNVCQVIIRNTHKPQDSQNSRNALAASIHRSHSLLTTHRTVILAPKRNERIRLEYALGDVWTRDKLPYPGMTTSRSGQIIRVSAGSLARKLSLASMHSPFARRSMSLSTANNRKSTETLPDGTTVETDVDHPTYSIVDETKTGHETQDDSVVTEDPIGGPESEARPERLSMTGLDRLLRRGTKKLRRMSLATVDAPPAAQETLAAQAIVEDKLSGRKRWSNPLGLLKNFSTEGVRHMLYSSK